MDKGVNFMTHASLRQFLLTPPQQLPQARTWGLPIGHMAYRLDEEGQLRQAPLPAEVQGGLMLVGATKARWAALTHAGPCGRSCRCARRGSSAG